MTDWSGDIAIIGAGIVGLATARELQRRRPRARIAVVEKEDGIGRHQTGHNSGVLHSGLYYSPGSLKARTCVAGAAALARYCDERGIPLERCGKVIVARDDSELDPLHELYRRGVRNGVDGLAIVGPERLREIEPHVEGKSALYSAGTAIVDFGLVAASLADDVKGAGGAILTAHEVVAVSETSRTVAVETTWGDLEAGRVIACAGLQADRVAALTGSAREPAIVPFRGDYWLLPAQRRHLVRSLVYPVPDPRFPFLGVHFTRRLDGEVWLGPSAVPALAREGYRRGTIELRDGLDTLTYPGFWRLVSRHAAAGLGEMIRDASRRTLLRSLRTFVPELELSDLLPGPSGIRAQALARDGTLVEDFVVEHKGRVTHVRNAPSPAATSSLAIADLVADAVEVE
ncbi:MAG: L-2-hydroxyglutarate oxidase [Deltaproteobacteria bacterium]|nr:L-2-hydroxyglutarate oxidase [Deltaproteobacteria bacterium]